MAITLPVADTTTVGFCECQPFSAGIFGDFFAPAQKEKVKKKAAKHAVF